jgi:parvulin-like peptidyl-prolyl isomerase
VAIWKIRPNKVLLPQNYHIAQAKAALVLKVMKKCGTPSALLLRQTATKPHNASRDPMALEINGERIEDAVIRTEAQLLKPRCAEMFAELDPIAAEMQVRELARGQVIERVLLQQEADRDASPIPPEALEGALNQFRLASSGESTCITPMNEESLLEDVKSQLRLDRLIGKIIGKVARPKPKDVVDYYRKNTERFEAPELLHAAHIVKNVDENNSEAVALAAIQEVRGKLEAGADFAELADTFSDCPGAGGDLGYFPRGQMVAEFDEVVFGLEDGQVSEIFRTPFGFHIAKVLDRKPAGIPPLAEVRDVIEDGLYRAKQESALHDYVERLRSKAQIRDVKTRAQG